MAWIAGNRFLSEEEMHNNAIMLYNYFYSVGWSLNAICGMLGNMQSESTINPGIWEGLQEGHLNVGYGLVQWTPASKYINWAGADYGDGNKQCSRIVWEKDNGAQWIPTSTYPQSFADFSVSTDSPYTLGLMFLACYERPFDPHQPIRGQQAEYWFEYLQQYKYVPRLNDEGIRGNPWYYSDNPFSQSGFGLPNCTCYAWGRRGEITGERPDLSLGNADSWWDYNIAHDVYPNGSTPRLGAIACWRYSGAHASQGGHVAIVEVIEGNNITTSNSAYGGTFFYTQQLSGDSGYEWASYTVFQGFIYLKNQPIPPEPPEPETKKKHLPIWMYTPW